MEEKDEMIRITVVIAGRPYPLKINANDEAVVRRLVNEVNNKIKQFQLTYQNREKQEHLSMTLLTYALDLHKARSINAAAAIPSNQLSNSLLQIDEMLEELLNQE